MNKPTESEGMGPLSMNVTLDDNLDIATVYGLRISGTLFRALAEPTPEGRWLRVVKVEDGIATLEWRTDLVPVGAPTGIRAHLAEILADGWKEIAAFFQERNWPDTKLGNAASAIDWRIKEIIAAVRQDRDARQQRVVRLLRAAESLEPGSHPDGAYDAVAVLLTAARRGVLPTAVGRLESSRSDNSGAQGERSSGPQQVRDSSDHAGSAGAAHRAVGHTRSERAEDFPVPHGVVHSRLRRGEACHRHIRAEVARQQTRRMHAPRAARLQLCGSDVLFAAQDARGIRADLSADGPGEGGTRWAGEAATRGITRFDSNTKQGATK